MDAPERQVSTVGRVPGQVCDRCRSRKIRCRPGSANDCQPCALAGVACISNAQLKRNRKRKSYYEAETIQHTQPKVPLDFPGNGQSNRSEPIDESFRQRATPELQLRPSVYETTDDNHSFHQDAPSTYILRPFEGSAAAFTSTEEAKRTGDPVVGHMGRLVTDVDHQVAMFAGSSTGVHFIHQAEQHLQMQHMHHGTLPVSAYGMYLSNIWTNAEDTTSTLVQSLVQQLPTNTQSVLEHTIDRWTPLYPVIHKPSVLEAYGALVSAQSTENGLQGSLLYQILALLALGSIGEAGPCTFEHFHFLCQSDVYYRMSTTLLNQVIGNPCLQSLQGLVLMQIYLQLTTRYTVASHIGGVATRIAQNLGLHRHSNRFKFDPLETELRRRVWWCQYSLDTFSSAYHGMPRLIRDQDVDTDLPTPVDHDLLSRAHVAFPLPGEATQVDTALLLFRLARIFGQILERLYTTTQRRGGVSKIARFQMELDMWERYLPSNLDEDQDTEFGASSSETSLQGLFLRVSHCIATIHIHRPALSFTTAHPQFSESLAICCKASGSLISLLTGGLRRLSTDTSDSLLVTLLYPNGTHMLWQAALTMLFARWKGQPLLTIHGNDIELIQHCVEALRQLHAATNSASAREILQCAETLHTLKEKTFSGTSTWNLETDQLQWNVWDWPMASALELSNTLDSMPLDLYI